MLSRDELKDLYGTQYVESFEKKQSTFKLERLVSSVQLSSQYKVADFGCGAGTLYPLLAGKVDSYTGIDFSEEFIRAAKNKQYQPSADVEFVCAEISIFCSENENVFDLAFAMDFSEHVYDEEWVGILQAIHASLKEGGRLYIHTPNAEFFLEIMKKHDFIVKQFPEHIAVRNVEENARLLEKSGFKITNVDLIPHYNILSILHPLSFIPFIGRYFKARIFIEATVSKSCC